MRAGLLVLRDNPVPDEARLIASYAWVDEQQVSTLTPDEERCTMRQVVTRAQLTPGVHRVVIASVFEGRGMWSGATWRACQELNVRFAGSEAVMVRISLRKRIAVDPFERFGFELQVEPPGAWIEDAPGTKGPSLDAMALCRSLDDYGAP